MHMQTISHNNNKFKSVRVAVKCVDLKIHPNASGGPRIAWIKTPGIRKGEKKKGSGDAKNRHF